MIPGGIASKIGNSYEAKWIALCLMHVIGGRYASLRFEGITPEYFGFECSVSTKDGTEWHQTKVSTSSGQWTIHKLNSEGVLEAFATRLRMSEFDTCIFVSQDGAKHFETLIKKAAISNDQTEFSEALPHGLKLQLTILQSHWNANAETTFRWLRRCKVETIPDSQIDSLIQTLGQYYIDCDTNDLFPTLRQFLENNFNKIIDAEYAKTQLNKLPNIKLKSWAFPETSKGKITAETDAYLGTYIPFGAGGSTVVRKQTEECLALLNGDSDCNLVLLTGSAGTGKSGIVRAIIGELRAENKLCLAFRIDHHLECASSRELGKRLLDYNESPAITLFGTAAGEQSVLVIDQVDSVSEVSGRDGRVKETIFNLIDECRTLGAVKVLVVCRTFDLETDHRLRQLKDSLYCRQVEVSPFDWAADVEPILIERSIDFADATPEQKSLLCSPVNLAVFLESGSPVFSLRTRTALYDELLSTKARKIVKYGALGWAIDKPLAALAKWMSSKQTLSAPLVLLDEFPRAKDILASESLIVVSRNMVNFFHESFFDFIFSRSFIVEQKTLVELLLSTEQHLFRRTQVRQILELLRQVDMNIYIANLSEVILSEKIRFHIKLAVAQWLSTVPSPTANEWELLSRFDSPGTPFSLIFRSAIFATENWFEHLLEIGWVEKELSGTTEERSRVIRWWLSGIAGAYPSQIATVLRAWWNNRPDRADTLLEWFGYLRQQKSSTELLDFCEEIIVSNPPSLFDSNRGRDRIMMLFHSWSEKAGADLGQLLKSLFTVWFHEHPGKVPFDYDEFKHLDIHTLKEISEKSPASFLKGMTDALVRSMELIAAEGKSGAHWYYTRICEPSEHMGGFDLFLSLYRGALQSVSATAPDVAAEILKSLNSNLHDCLMHLHLEAIQANPTNFSNRLVRLMKSEAVFEAGFEGVEWNSFARAVRSCWPVLNVDERTQVERLICMYRPEISWAVKQVKELSGDLSPSQRKQEEIWIVRELARSGYRQWCILQTLQGLDLGEVLQKTFRELDRKFAGAKVSEARRVQVSWVGSPIKREKCEQMSDTNWLSAIARYDREDERRRGRDFIDGGARQLSLELKEIAKNAPERFARLAMQIPDSSNECYLEQIIYAFAEAEINDFDLISEVLIKAHRLHRRSTDSAIIWALQKHPDLACSPQLSDILVWYACEGNASEDKPTERQNANKEIVTIDNLISNSDALHVRGINGERGSAWEAIASVLWSEKADKVRLYDVLERRSVEEPLMSVKCRMVRSLGPLFNDDKVRFVQILRNLMHLESSSAYSDEVDVALSPLVTNYAIHLSPFIAFHLPDFFLELHNRLHLSSKRELQLIGAWLMFRANCQGERYGELADRLATQSVDHKRLHADVLANAITWADSRTKNIETLKSYFNDPDDQVQSQSADVFRSIKPSEFAAYIELANSFVRSEAFKSHGFGFLHSLENAECNVLDLVIEATEAATSVSRGPVGSGGKMSNFHSLQNLLRREYNSSDGKVDQRKRILDAIDLMLSAEVYGASEIVAAHER